MSPTGWHWNEDKIDFTPTLDYGQKIYSEIIRLANLVDDDNAILSSDKAVSRPDSQDSLIATTIKRYQGRDETRKIWGYKT